ncbi:hypothetical protein ACH5RR_032420 [Cinchona calisaya]|uniref:Uncharacterized protein n=1 Tax=Cinchona calisaya TaxID=153742 RepID=A0ABD2YJ50_9GENT
MTSRYLETALHPVVGRISSASSGVWRRMIRIKDLAEEHMMAIPSKVTLLFDSSTYGILRRLLPNNICSIIGKARVASLYDGRRAKVAQAFPLYISDKEALKAYRLDIQACLQEMEQYGILMFQRNTTIEHAVPLLSTSVALLPIAEEMQVSRKSQRAISSSMHVDTLEKHTTLAMDFVALFLPVNVMACMVIDDCSKMILEKALDSKHHLFVSHEYNDLFDAHRNFIPLKIKEFRDFSKALGLHWPNKKITHSQMMVPAF